MLIIVLLGQLSYAIRIQLKALLLYTLGNKDKWFPIVGAAPL